MGQVIYMADFRRPRKQPVFPNPMTFNYSPQTTDRLNLSVEILTLEQRIAILRNSIPTFATVEEREGVVLRMLALSEKMVILKEQLRKRIES